MVTQLGMSEELGPIKFGQGQSEVFLGRDFSNGRNYSEEIASKIDSEIHRIISEAYENAKRTLSENMDKMTFIAEYLVKNEVMDGEQFKKVMEEDTTFEELDEMVAEKRRRSAEENERRRAVIEENERRREEERKKEEEAKKLEEARKNSPFGFDPPREDKNDGSDENE